MADSIKVVPRPADAANYSSGRSGRRVSMLVIQP